MNQENNPQSNTTNLVSNYEIYVLRTIELNDSMRNEVVGIDNSLLPINWSSSNFPTSIENTIKILTPSSLVCQAQICLTYDTCELGSKLNKDVYAQSIFITATDNSYNPKQLKLFCWAKQ